MSGSAALQRFIGAARDIFAVFEGLSFRDEPSNERRQSFRAALASLHEELALAGIAASAPVDMVLHCPACHLQHIDRAVKGWDNPPHRSHLCERCGVVWRPADVYTNGVRAVKTRGAADTPYQRPEDHGKIAGVPVLLDDMRPEGESDARLSALARRIQVLEGAAVVKGDRIDALLRANTREVTRRRAAFALASRVFSPVLCAQKRRFVGAGVTPKPMVLTEEETLTIFTALCAWQEEDK